MLTAILGFYGMLGMLSRESVFSTYVGTVLKDVVLLCQKLLLKIYILTIINAISTCKYVC